MKKKFNTKKVLTVVGATITIMALPELAQAATQGASGGSGAVFGAFDGPWIDIQNFMKGSFGKLLAGLSVIGGVAAGLIKNNIWAFATGLGIAIGFNQAPALITALFPAAASAAEILNVLPGL
jgi:conjugal transfer pilus assembly protein TraA